MLWTKFAFVCKINIGRFWQCYAHNNVKKKKKQPLNKMIWQKEMFEGGGGGILSGFTGLNISRQHCFQCRSLFWL